MDESEFIRLAEQTLQELDRRIEASGIDADCAFKGTGVLEMEFGDGSKIIVNSQAAAREIWVAAKSGGSHFRGDGGRWVNTRDGTELFAALSAYVSQQVGETVNLVTGNVQSIMGKTAAPACPFPLARRVRTTGF